MGSRGVIGEGLSEIPKFYIVNRWTKIATSKPIFDYDGNILEACSKSQSQTKMISDTLAQLFKCMHMADNCKEKLQLVQKETYGIELKLKQVNGNDVSSKVHEFESFTAYNVPKEIEIFHQNLQILKDVENV
ncbi:hypothetical protein Lal_00035283 [Lupinus albus]|nr:hypothetical protein Lal_00035283 [Lupinus albus]